MEDILQVAFLTIICLLAGGFGTISIVAVSVFASRRSAA
jgi:hypothetical protein